MSDTRLRFHEEFSLGGGTSSYAHVRLSKTKQQQAERIARKMIKELRSGDGVLCEDWLVDSVYDEATQICGNSQYDDDRGHDLWWALREAAERLVIAAVRAEGLRRQSLASDELCYRCYENTVVEDEAWCPVCQAKYPTVIDEGED